MIAEAIIRKDGLFIKGYKPDKQGKRITVRIEQLPEQSAPPTCRGILQKFAKKELISKEANAWKNRVRDE